jgi:gamma-glutamyl hercynylcysteine S-oxide synthase
MTRLSITDARAVRLSRADLVDRYRRNRARSRELFALLSDEAYYDQPIAQRHPIVFYEGHLPGFSFNTLVRKALGGPSIDTRLERLFARGIDPPEGAAARPQTPGPQVQWPSREVVRAFATEADRLVIDALQHADIERPGHPLLDRGEAVFAILEHEEMHQETLQYMWHRLPFTQKTAPAGYQPSTEGAVAPAEWVRVPAGRATLGVDRTAIPFGWDNECPAWSVAVPSFSIERHDVTNERFLEFVEAGGYRDPRWWTADDWQWRQTEELAHPLFWERTGGAWFWRGMFGLIPLPASWPVYVSLAEASAFTRWRGTRLPT